MSDPTEASGSATPLPESGATARARGDVRPLSETTARWVRSVLRALSKANALVYPPTHGRVWGTLPGGAPAWPHILKTRPDFEDYPARTERKIPMFVGGPEDAR